MDPFSIGVAFRVVSCSIGHLDATDATEVFEESASEARGFVGMDNFWISEPREHFSYQGLDSILRRRRGDRDGFDPLGKRVAAGQDELVPLPRDWERPKVIQVDSLEAVSRLV